MRVVRVLLLIVTVVLVVKDVETKYSLKKNPEAIRKYNKST